MWHKTFLLLVVLPLALLVVSGIALGLIIYRFVEAKDDRGAPP